jgi:hypothetical protein
VSQIISLTTALTSANASIIQTSTKVGEETKHQLVEAQELIKQQAIEHQETYRRMLVAETKVSMLNDFSAKEKTNREEEREYISKVQNQCQNTPQLNLLERVVMKDAARAAPTPTNTFPDASVSTLSSSPLTATPIIQQPIITNQQPPPQQQQTTYPETFSPVLQQSQNSVDFQHQPLPAISSSSQLQPQRRFETHNQSNAQVLPSSHLNYQTWQYTSKQQDPYYQLQQEQNSCMLEQQLGQYHQPPSQKQYQQQSPRPHYQQTQQQSQQDQRQNYQQLTQQYQQSQQQSYSYQYQQPQSQHHSQHQYHQQQCLQSQQYQQDASAYHQQQPQKNQHILQQYQLHLNNQSLGRTQQQNVVRHSEMQKLSEEKCLCYCNVPRIRDGDKFCGSCGGVVTIKLACCGIVSSGSFCTNCGTPKGFN